MTTTKIIYSLIVKNNQTSSEYSTAWGGNYSAFSKNILSKVLPASLPLDLRIKHKKNLLIGTI
jgi:hypothetical protein